MLDKHSASWSTPSAPVTIILFVVLEVKPKVIGKFSTYSQLNVLLLETSAQEVQTRAGKVEEEEGSLWYLDPSTVSLGTWQQEGWSRGGWACQKVARLG